MQRCVKLTLRSEEEPTLLSFTSWHFKFAKLSHFGKGCGNIVKLTPTILESIGIQKSAPYKIGRNPEVTL